MPTPAQRSVAVRNAQGDAFEATIGTDAKLEIRTGAKPANCAAAATGTQLVLMNLPTDWLANAAAGVKAKAGTWSGTAIAAGTAGYYRILDNAGTTCHEQGLIGTGEPMEIDNAVIAIGQTVTVTAYQ